MKKSIIYLNFIFCFHFKIQAQDIHFSQFNEQPALINPALTGSSNAIRVSIGYKDQWRSVTSSFKTLGVSSEMRIKPGNWEVPGKFKKKNSSGNVKGRFALGLSVYNDNAGDGNMRLNQVNLSMASFVVTSARSLLSLGLQSSLAQRRLDNSKLIFPNQYDGATYNSSMNSGENFSSLNFSYADFAGGILWCYSKPDKRIRGHKALGANVGFSFYHVNKSAQKYLATNQSSLYLKYIFHGDFLIGIAGSNMAIAPIYLIQLQGSSREILGGVLFKSYLDNDSKYTGLYKRSNISYGGCYRYQDAAILNIQYEHHEQYAIGLSYDLNLSQLTNASKARGGIEIMMKYTPMKDLKKIEE